MGLGGAKHVDHWFGVSDSAEAAERQPLVSKIRSSVHPAVEVDECFNLVVACQLGTLDESKYLSIILGILPRKDPRGA